MKLKIKYKAKKSDDIKYVVRNKEDASDLNELLYHFRNFLLSAGYVSLEDKRLSVIDENGKECFSSEDI